MLKNFFAFLLILLITATPFSALAQQEIPENANITFPQPGEPIQGIVPIIGTIRARGFVAAELSFGYTSASVPTWFLIRDDITPMLDDVLAEWDTSLLSDGDYTLRLIVTRDDGSQETILVEGVRVRNYSIVETATPTSTPTKTPAPTTDPLRFTSTPAPTETGTPPPPPTSTPLPRNPAQLSTGAITNTLIRSAAGALAAFLILGIYVTLRNSIRK